MSAIVSSGFGVESHVGIGLGFNVKEIAIKIFGNPDSVVALIRSPKGAAQKWETLPRHLWDKVKPKGQRVLKFVAIPRGGDGGGVFGIIAAIVVSIAAPFLAGAVLGLSGVAATAATLAITAGASALLGSLFAPSPSATQRNEESAQQRLVNVEADQNTLAKGDKLPQIFGCRRISPPAVIYPHRRLESGSQIVETILGFDGEHELTDIQIDGIGIDNLPNVEYQVLDGNVASPNQTLINNISIPRSIDETFTSFSLVQGENELADQAEPTNSEPKSFTFSSGFHESVEQITLRIAFSAFVIQTNNTDNARLPIRIRFWPKDNPEVVHKVNEIHVFGRIIDTRLKEIKFRWDGNFGVASSSQDYGYAFFQTVPPADNELTTGETGNQWEADVFNVRSDGDGINIQLDEDVIPRGEYEIEVLAGMPFNDSDFVQSSYELNGAVHSFFHGYLDDDTWLAPPDQLDVTAGGQAQFATLVADEIPVQTNGVAHIAIKARDQSLRNVTVKAGRRVVDWNGSEWTGSVVSSNPATHAYNAAINWLDFQDVNRTLLNSDQFVAWRQECEDKGYTCSYVAIGNAFGEVLSNLCTAGLATPTYEDGYSIHYFRDRSGDIPEMTFSHRDSRIAINKEFVETPKGFRVQFQNRENDWRDEEVVFNNPYSMSQFRENETVNYPSIDDPEHIKRRAIFDMLNLRYRPRRYSISTNPAGFNLTRGSLINVISDLDGNPYKHGFFIKQVTSARTLVIDRIVPEKESVFLDDVADFTMIENLLEQGETTAALILEPTGIQEYTVSDLTGDVITLSEDLPETWVVNGEICGREILSGSRLNVLPRSEMMKRMIVYSVARESEERCLITAVDEAPEINTELTRLFQGTA